MKKCPKCGALNKPENSACYNCFTSLEGVSVSDAPVSPQVPSAGAPPSSQGQPPSVQGPAIPSGNAGYTPRANGPLGSHEESSEPVSVVGQPLGGYREQQPVTNIPHVPVTRRGEYRHPEPIKQSNIGSTIAMVFLLLAILGGGGFTYWKFIYLPNTPVGVVRAFAKAADSGDTEAIKKYITESSLSIPGFMEGFSKGFFLGQQSSDKKEVEGKDYLLEAGTVEDSKATVYIKPGPEASEQTKEMQKVFKEGIPIILIKEKKSWKIDLMQTGQAIMGPLMLEMQKQFGGKMPGGTGGMPGLPPGSSTK